MLPLPPPVSMQERWQVTTIMPTPMAFHPQCTPPPFTYCEGAGDGGSTADAARECASEAAWKHAPDVFLFVCLLGVCFRCVVVVLS
eukprot:5818466-Pyramimonas_sp.AAC.1